MNNYCTNCGNKLDKKDLVCSKCNTPLVDLSNDDSNKLSLLGKILIIIFIVILCVVTFYELKGNVDLISKNNNVKKFQTEYIEPYLKENYANMNYSIEFDSTDKCVISGNCAFDPVFGCDGGSCQEYMYLDDENCKSYYYNVKNDTDDFILTVVSRNNTIYVVEGKNIYGKEKNNN